MPRQLPNITHAHPLPNFFHLKEMPLSDVCGISRNFSRLSPCKGQVAYALLTRAPVADKSIATLSLPLDLHVLSLSLAFILSQDQTLRCYLCFLFFFLYLTTARKPTSVCPDFCASSLDGGLPPSSFVLSFYRIISMFSFLATRLISRLRVQRYGDFSFLPNIFDKKLCCKTCFFLSPSRIRLICNILLK